MTPKQRITNALTLRIAPLSFGRLVAIVSGLLTIAAAGGAMARVAGHVETKAHAEKAFVSTDTFRVFQQGWRETRIADSLNHGAEIRDIHRMLARLDSSDRCRRGMRQFC